jgi:hypothetical protein
MSINENPTRVSRDYDSCGFTDQQFRRTAALSGLSTVDETGLKDTVSNDPAPGGEDMNDKAEDPRIRRARLSGPEQVTKDATVAEMAADGTMSVLVKGTNEWVCTPGNENKIGAPPMCMSPMAMRWMMDAIQGKPKPGLGNTFVRGNHDEHRARNDLHAVRRHTEKQHQSCG